MRNSFGKTFTFLPASSQFQKRNAERSNLRNVPKRCNIASGVIAKIVPLPRDYVRDSGKHGNIIISSENVTQISLS